MAELGPGASIGIGIAAILTGSKRYYALDVVPYLQSQSDLTRVDEIVRLLRERSRLHPAVEPYVGGLEFPGDVMPDTRVEQATDPTRIADLRAALQAGLRSKNYDVEVSYVVPWDETTSIRDGCADVVLSQAVMEHVDAVEHTYNTLFRWLKPGSVMSHQIDYRSHGMASTWDGHRTYSDLTWRVIRGRRPYLLNRLPHSEHLRLIGQAGFDTVLDTKVGLEPTISRERLNARFAPMTDEDRHTSEAFILSVKRK